MSPPPLVRPANALAGPALAALGGGLVGLACLWPGAWPLALAGLPIHAAGVLRDARTRGARSVISAFVGTFAWHAIAMHWVVLAVRDDMPHRTAGQVLVLATIASVQALWVALAWAPLQWLVSRPAARGPLRDAAPALAWTVAWAAADAWRHVGWWGDGYGEVAAALADTPGLGAWLPVVGAQGVGWVAMALAAWLARQVPGRGAASGTRASRRATATGASLVAVAAVITPVVGRIDWTQPVGRALPVVVVQPARDKHQGWNVAERDRLVDLLVRALRALPPGGLAVTPETYFYEPLPAAPVGRWADVVDAADRDGSVALVGAPQLARLGGELREMNAAVEVSARGRAIYAKERLLPGVEFLPFRGLLGRLYRRLFHDVDEGEAPAPRALQAPIVADGHQLGVTICHEQAFALTVADRARGSDVLVTLAEDSWMPSAAYRHEMATLARLRAGELRKPLLRASNGGPSLLVEPDGRVRNLGDFRTPGLLRATVHGRLGDTPYARACRVLAVLPALAWLLAAAALLLPLSRSPGRRAAAPREPRPLMP